MSMSVSVSRRQFFRTCGAGASAVAFSTLTPRVARAANTAEIELVGFEGKAKKLVGDAARMAVSRMQSKVVRDKLDAVGAMHALSKEAQKLVADPNLSHDVTAEELMCHQLRFLAEPNGEHDELPAFPKITIEAHEEHPEKSKGQKGWVGHALPDKVVIYFKGFHKKNGKKIPDWTYRGAFELCLNPYFLFLNKRYSMVEEWASTIAHEMAHNLGHEHPPGKGPWQVEALNDAVFNG